MQKMISQSIDRTRGFTLVEKRAFTIVEKTSHDSAGPGDKKPAPAEK